MRFLFDAAVVGSAADVSRAKAALRREERQDVQKIQAESVGLIFTGKFGGKFTWRVRMRFGRNGRIKSHARGSGEKTGRKRSVLTKTVAKKVSRG